MGCCQSRDDKKRATTSWARFLLGYNILGPGVLAITLWRCNTLVMAILYHPLGLEHPLVKELNEASRKMGISFLKRQRARRGSSINAEIDSAVSILEAEQQELVRERESVEARIQQEPKTPNTARLQATLIAKRRQLAALQCEIAELQRRLDVDLQESATKQRLADYLARRLDRDDDAGHQRTVG